MVAVAMMEAEACAPSAAMECTSDTHRAIKALGPRVLLNTRAWPEASAHVGECPLCCSTLMIPFDRFDEED
jgi:hypothetical protein